MLFAVWRVYTKYSDLWVVPSVHRVYATSGCPQSKFNTGCIPKVFPQRGFLNKTRLSFQSIISSTLFPESSNHVFKSIPSTRVYTSNVKGAMSQDCLPLFFALNTLQSTVCGPLMNRLKQFRELGRDDPPVMIPPVMIPLSWSPCYAPLVRIPLSWSPCYARHDYLS